MLHTRQVRKPTRGGHLEREGVKVSVSNLRTFPFVRKLEEEGRLSVHGTYFEIESGTLAVFDQSRNEFCSV